MGVGRPPILRTYVFVRTVAICIVSFYLSLEVFHLYFTFSKSLLELHLLFPAAHVSVNATSDTEGYESQSKGDPQENIDGVI